MKLAIIVPVPDLTRFGYGRIAAECIGSMARIADVVHLMSSTRGDTAWQIARKYSNVFLNSNESTWFARTPEGEEWFDPYKVMENTNLMLGRLREAHYDVAACLMCNQYIPEAGEFYQHCYQMLEKDIPGYWVYRMDQLGNQLFHASVKVPFIINLHSSTSARWSTDATAWDDGLISRMERGNYTVLDAISVVDVQLEITREELAAKQNYIRCYHDILPKRKPVFEWDYWFPYYVDKFQKKLPAGTVTDPIGLAIAAKSESGFVSQQVLAAL